MRSVLAVVRAPRHRSIILLFHKYMLKQGIINGELGRDTTTAVSQLTVVQQFKNIKKIKTARLHMAIKNNNEDGAPH